MFYTIQLSSCISVQGRIVESRANGEVVIRSGKYLFRGRPVVTGKAPKPLLHEPRSPEIRRS